MKGASASRDPTWVRSESAVWQWASQRRVRVQGSDMGPLRIRCLAVGEPKARPRPGIRHGSAQDPLFDSRIFGGGADPLRGA